MSAADFWAGEATMARRWLRHSLEIGDQAGAAAAQEAIDKASSLAAKTRNHNAVGRPDARGAGRMDDEIGGEDRAVDERREDGGGSREAGQGSDAGELAATPRKLDWSTRRHGEIWPTQEALLSLVLRDGDQ